MNAKISVFVICDEATIYLLLNNLHDCTFKSKDVKRNKSKSYVGAAIQSISLK